MKLTQFKKIILAWLPYAASIIFIGSIVFISSQQILRQSANDPQIQIAEDLSEAITKGQPADRIAPAIGDTDISKSLSVFVMIYDQQGKLLGTSAQLDGKAPEFPKSVLENFKNSEQDRITWQPKNGLRFASVVQKFGGNNPGYVVISRSLREIEKREDQMLIISLGGTISTLLIVLLIMVLLSPTENLTQIHAEVEEIVVVQKS